MDHVAQIQEKTRVESTKYNVEFIKMETMLGISPNNPDVLLKYLGGLHNHLQNSVIMFKTRTMDEVCVHAQYLENIGQNKGETKWFEVERAPRRFQGGEEEVERWKR